MIDTHRQVAEFEGCRIYLRQPGFEFTPVMLAKVASYIVEDADRNWMIVAFMYSLLLKIDDPDLDESDLLAAAADTIRTSINQHGVPHRAERTFEYRDGAFVEAASPAWWISTHR